jgi:hypothetical protein
VIDDVSRLLRHLFVNQVPDLRVPNAAAVIADQVRFDPPDDAFAGLAGSVVVNTPGGTVQAPVLNVYMADLRENRKLRSNERVRTNGGSHATDVLAPARVDCHFLITAWTPATAKLNVEPTLDELALLHQVLVALFRNAPLNASRMVPPLGGLPALIQDADLPTSVAPVEGFPALGEFWSTMSPSARWLPVVHVVVTVPVAYEEEITGPLVTTKVTTFSPGTETETFVQIGGVLLDKTGAPVEGAWLRLESALGVALQVTGSGADGRFTFDGLPPGTYTVRARRPGLGETTDQLTVPSPTGGYEVQF